MTNKDIDFTELIHISDSYITSDCILRDGHRRKHSMFLKPVGVNNE